MGDAETMPLADAARRDPLSRPSADAEGHPFPPSGFAEASAFAKASADLSPGKQGGGEVVDWAEVRRAYELGAESVASIQRRFGLTPYQLRRVREDEDWTKREPVIKPGPLQGHKAVGVDSLELKLNKLVAIGIAMLEQKVADEGMTETNARTLNELCRAQETRMRSTRNEKAAKAREKKNTDDGHDFRDDPAWLDAEFKRRLDRMLDAEGEAGGVGPADDRGAAGAAGELAG